MQFSVNLILNFREKLDKQSNKAGKIGVFEEDFEGKPVVPAKE